MLPATLITQDWSIKIDFNNQRFIVKSATDNILTRMLFPRAFQLEIQGPQTVLQPLTPGNITFASPCQN